MYNLYIIEELVTNNMNYLFIILITILSVLSGIAVIINKNPILSVLFLIGLFLSIAGYLMMLGLNFIGLSYLLVYVGAVSILFLFILMLINVRVSELINDTSNSIPLGILTGIILASTIYPILSLTGNIYSKNETGLNSNYLDTINISLPIEKISNILSIFNLNTFDFFSQSNKLLYVNSQNWDSSLAESSDITSIGNIIYVIYPLSLFLTAIVLLLAMVGCIIITLKKE